MSSEGKAPKRGRVISVYITDAEWDLLSAKIREQGQEGTERQITLFAKQWAKAGLRMPIREELEQVMFKVKRPS